MMMLVALFGIRASRQCAMFIASIAFGAVFAGGCKQYGTTVIDYDRGLGGLYSYDLVVDYGPVGPAFKVANTAGIIHIVGSAPHDATRVSVRWMEKRGNESAASFVHEGIPIRGTSGDDVFIYIHPDATVTAERRLSDRQWIDARTEEAIRRNSHADQ